MKKWLSILALLLSVAIVLSGCGEQILEGNKLVNGANKHLNDAVADVMKVESISKQLSSLPQTEAGMKRGKMLSKQGAQLALGAVSNSTEALKELKKARKLSLSDDFITYLDLKISATEALIDAVTVTRQYMESSNSMFELALTANSQSELAPSIKKVTRLGRKAEKTLNGADNLQRKAEAFFKDKRILG